MKNTIIFLKNCRLGTASCTCNLTFALSFVHDLHVQCGSVCQKFAYSVYLDANVQHCLFIRSGVQQ